jgi:uncharacterized SAM-binding protein YcdF (DUF218 family)
MYHGLASPWRVTLTVGLVVGLLAMLSPSVAWRRRMGRGALALLVLYWWVVSPLFAIPAIYGLTRAVPPDRGQAADAIVVQARNDNISGDRYDTALGLLAAGRAKQLLIFGDWQGRRMYQALRQRGLPTDSLLTAICARTTHHEAELTAALLGQTTSSIILITDAPHMLRSWLTFKSLGLTVIPHSEPLPSRLSSPDRSFLAVREYLGLASYALLGRFQQQPPEHLPEVAAALAKEFPRDRCLITPEELDQWFQRRAKARS